MKDSCPTLAEVVSALSLATSSGSALQQVVDVASSVSSGYGSAGVSAVRGHDLVGAASSDPRVGTVDAAQNRLGEGPGVDALDDGDASSADLRDETRWGGWRSIAREQGIEAVHASALGTVEDRLGVLTVYGDHPTVTGDPSRSALLVWALVLSHASLALAAAEARAQADTMAESLATRDVIGQAMGVLMERFRVPADQAFDVLRRASQHENRKLRLVAKEVAMTGELPGPVSIASRRE